MRYRQCDNCRTLLKSEDDGLTPTTSSLPRSVPVATEQGVPKLCPKCQGAGLKLVPQNPSPQNNNQAGQEARPVNWRQSGSSPLIPISPCVSSVGSYSRKRAFVMKRRRGGTVRVRLGYTDEDDVHADVGGMAAKEDVEDYWQVGKGRKVKRPKIQARAQRPGKVRGRGRAGKGSRITSVDTAELQAAEGMLGITGVQLQDEGSGGVGNADVAQGSKQYGNAQANSRNYDACSDRREGQQPVANCPPKVHETAELLSGEQQHQYSDDIEPRSPRGSLEVSGKHGGGQGPGVHESPIGRGVAGIGTKKCRRCQSKKPGSEFVEPRRRGWYTCNSCREATKQQRYISSTAFRSEPLAPACYQSEKRAKGIKFDYECSLPEVKRHNQRWRKLSQVLEQLSEQKSKTPNFSTVPRLPIPIAAKAEHKKNEVADPETDPEEEEREHSDEEASEGDLSSDGSQDSLKSDEFLKCEECKQVKPCEAFKPEGSLLCTDCQHRRGKVIQLASVNKAVGVPYGVHTHNTPLVICDESSGQEGMEKTPAKDCMITPPNGCTVGESSQEDTGDYEKLLEMKSCNSAEPNMMMSPGCFFPALQPSDGHQPAILNPPCGRTPPLELEGLSASGMRSNRRKSRKGRTPVRYGQYQARGKQQDGGALSCVEISGKSIRISSVNPWCLPKHVGEKAALFREVDLEASLSSVGISGLVSFLLS